MKDRSLDQLLKEWAGRSQPDRQAVERIQSRIAYRIRQMNDKVGDSADEAVSFVPWARLVYGLVAVFAIVVVGALYAWRRSPPHVPPGRPAVDFVRFTDQEIAARAMVMDEMRTLFDDHLRWVLIGDYGMRFGLSSDAPPAVSPHPWLLVRTVLAIRTDGRHDWTAVWTADTLFRAEEHVFASLRNGESVDLDLWAHRLPGGDYFLESHIQWPSRNDIRAHEFLVLADGEAARIHSGRTLKGEYRLYQSVHPLPSREG